VPDKIVRTDDEGLRILRDLKRWWLETQGHGLEDERDPDPRDQTPIPMLLGRVSETIRPGTGSTAGPSTGGKIHPFIHATTAAGSTQGEKWSIDTGTTYQAFDLIGCGATTGEDVWAWRHQGSGQLHIQAVPSQRCRGFVVSSHTSTGLVPTCFAVDRIEPLFGVSPTTGGCVQLQVANPHGWVIYPNALVKFERRNNAICGTGSTGTGNCTCSTYSQTLKTNVHKKPWEAYQVSCSGTSGSTCNT